MNEYGFPDDGPQRETVATFDHEGVTYELDHLGIGYDSQRGEFAVFTGHTQVTAFYLDVPAGEPVDVDAAVAAAKDELTEEPGAGETTECGCPENRLYGTCGH